MRRGGRKRGSTYVRGPKGHFSNNAEDRREYQARVTVMSAWGTAAGVVPDSGDLELESLVRARLRDGATPVDVDIDDL
jgi:hypothetical protein